MKACVIIPARYASSRFPGKPLVPILGVPMIVRVANISAAAIGKEHVYVATEDARIKKCLEDAGFNAVMTSPSALTGTDRIAEAIQSLDYDVVINVQGDEPLLDPLDINRCLREKQKTPNQVINGYTWISERENPASVNIPKLVTTENDLLLYMSRAVVPGHKEPTNAPRRIKKQVCIYGFSRQELGDFHAFGRKSQVEEHEDIEILRFFEWGQTVRMFRTSTGSLAVDTPEDVALVEAALSSQLDQ